MHTDAVVLRTLNFRETSRIATLFTREEGRMGVVAKGARRPRSRIGPCLQPLAYLHVVVHVRPDRELQILTEASHARLFPRLSTSLERITTGYKVIELLRALVEDGEQDEGLFALLVYCLQLLDTPETSVNHVFPYFQMRLASALGFEPRFTRNSIVQLTDGGGMLQLEAGTVAPPSGTGPGLQRGSRAALRAFAIYCRANFSDIQRMHLGEDVRAEVSRLIEAYFRYHTEGSYPSRSTKVLSQLRPPRS